MAHLLLKFGCDAGLLEPVIASVMSDPEMRGFVTRRLWEASKIEDVMSELIYCGWVRSKGMEYEPVQDCGRADGVAFLEGCQIQVEVKTIQSLEAKLKKRVEQANKQFKRAPEQCPSLCVIRYPYWIYAAEREGRLSRPLAEIDRILSGPDYKSVSAVVLVWDEIFVEFWSSTIGLYATRSSKLFCHRKARHPLTGRLEDLCPAAIAVARVVLSKHASA